MSHVTTIGPYTVERIVSDHEYVIEWHERDGDIVRVRRCGPWLAGHYATAIRQLADHPACPDPDTERALADALDDAAQEPDMCRCGHRWASWGELCSVCSEAADNGGCVA